MNHRHPEMSCEFVGARGRVPAFHFEFAKVPGLRPSAPCCPSPGVFFNQ
jgi:hypothetical protein